MVLLGGCTTRAWLACWLAASGSSSVIHVTLQYAANPPGYPGIPIPRYSDGGGFDTRFVKLKLTASTGRWKEGYIGTTQHVLNSNRYYAHSWDRLWVVGCGSVGR